MRMLESCGARHGRGVSVNLFRTETAARAGKVYVHITYFWELYVAKEQRGVCAASANKLGVKAGCASCESEAIRHMISHTMCGDTCLSSSSL